MGIVSNNASTCQHEKVSPVPPSPLVDGTPPRRTAARLHLCHVQRQEPQLWQHILEWLRNRNATTKVLMLNHVNHPRKSSKLCSLVRSRSATTAATMHTLTTSLLDVLCTSQPPLASNLPAPLNLVTSSPVTSNKRPACPGQRQSHSARSKHNSANRGPHLRRQRSLSLHLHNSQQSKLSRILQTFIAAGWRLYCKAGHRACSSKLCCPN